MSNTPDVTDNMENDLDLLSILEQDDVDDINKSISSEEDTKSEEDEALAKFREKSNELVLSGEVEVVNQGSGDLDTDLANWFNGTDKVPSEPLTSYNLNGTFKMDYGLTRSTLSNYEMMGKLNKFLNDSFNMLFEESAILSLDNDDLLDRYKTAFAMYKELANLNQKTVMSLKDYNIKNGVNDGEVDTVGMLLSSIPVDKLKKVLEEIMKG